MIKKVIISGVIITGLVSSSFAVQDITYYGVSDGDAKISAINFSDVLNKGEKYWAKPAIYQIASLGIMQGFSSQIFSPITEVTNEQAIVTILNSMGKSKDIEASNVIVNYWSDKYIKYAMSNGLISEKTVLKLEDIKGNVDAMKSKGVYVRNASITREEVAALIVKAFSIPTTSTDEAKKPIDFADSTEIEDNKKVYVDAVSLNGIMIGSEDGMFYPKSGLTRAEFAQILKNCEEYMLVNLGVTKHSGFIDSVSTASILVADENGNDVNINVTGMNIPVIRNNQLTGVSSLQNSDEIEFFVDSTKHVKFIKVIDENINNEANESQEKAYKQGIVAGNSPYFYEISIKDANGSIEKYKYGRWTYVYKDGKETSSSDILQGDTVYLEFDDVGNLVVIRGITNSTIKYGTIIDVDGSTVSMRMDDSSITKYNLYKVPVYKNNEEIVVSKLYKGEYAKIYSSKSELIKVEVVQDERTVEEIYKGYISDINLIKDRIIIRNPEKFENGKWIDLETGFITIPLDKDIKINYDGMNLKKEELGQKQVGKFAYIATREDTQVLEKVKSISIGVDEKEINIVGKVSSYSERTGVLRIDKSSIKPCIDDSTIFVINGKIVDETTFSKGDKVAIAAAYENDEYIAKVITNAEVDKSRDVWAYFGKATDINVGKEVSMTVTSKYEDEEWEKVNRRDTSFTITSDTRIFNQTEPLNLKEYAEEYEGLETCVVAYGDEAVIITLAALTDNPYVMIGSVKSIGTDEFIITDTEIYDIINDEWIEKGNETVKTLISTAITKDGNYARFSDIKEGQEVVVIKPDSLSEASTVLLKD